MEFNELLAFVQDQWLNVRQRKRMRLASHDASEHEANEPPTQVSHDKPMDAAEVEGGGPPREIGSDDSQGDEVILSAPTQNQNLYCESMGPVQIMNTKGVVIAQPHDHVPRLKRPRLQVSRSEMRRKRSS